MLSTARCLHASVINVCCEASLVLVVMLRRDYVAFVGNCDGQFSVTLSYTSSLLDPGVVCVWLQYLRAPRDEMNLLGHDPALYQVV